MKANQTFTATLLALVVGNVMSSSQSSLGRFSFDYSIHGEGRAKPVQVFDDGARTYLQFRQGEAVPALLSANGDRLFIPALEGPYVVIAGTPRDLVSQMGLSRTRITHTSLMSNAPQVSPDGRAAPPTHVLVASTAPVALPQMVAAAAPAQIPNSWTDNSYATPRRGDRIEWTSGVSSAQKSETVYFVRGDAKLTKDGAAALERMGRSMGNAGQVIVLGRDDDSFREGLGEQRARAMADVLVRAGVPREVISVRSTAEGAAELRQGTAILVPSQIRWAEKVLVQAPQQQQPARTMAMNTPGANASAAVAQAGPQLWEMRRTDQTMEGVLKRWAGESGWRLVWRNGPDVAITGDASFSRESFISAADYVVTQARAAGYRITATSYSNNTLVISE